MPLQLNGKNFIVEQEATITASRDDIISKLKIKPIEISLYNVKDVLYLGIELYIFRYNTKGGVVNFINFNDDTDPVL
ncbi:MAG: hypothetical protein ACR5KV_05300 [Wolbachia sp.]